MGQRSMDRRLWAIGLGVGTVLLAAQTGLSQGTSPCALRYFSIEPQKEIAGPWVEPGQYWVYVGEGRSPSSWRKSGPYLLRQGSDYVVNIYPDGTVGVRSANSGNPFREAAALRYANGSFQRIFSVTVCPK